MTEPHTVNLHSNNNKKKVISSPGTLSLFPSKAARWLLHTLATDECGLNAADLAIWQKWHTTSESFVLTDYWNLILYTILLPLDAFTNKHKQYKPWLISF